MASLLTAPQKTAPSNPADAPESESPATLTDEAHPGDSIRPSPEEWYPRLHLGWSFKECVDVYCYFLSRSYNPKSKIQWAIHPLGTPFYGKRQLSSFDHILGISDVRSDSDTVKKAIVRGLSEQYFSQVRFEKDTPVCEIVEPTPEEHFAAWEDYSLDILEEGNVNKVQDAIMTAFGIYVTKDEVELLTRFSILSKVSPFETNTWRHILCYRCSPRKETSPGVPATATISREENLLKRKQGDVDKIKDKPAIKKPAPPAMSAVTSNTVLASILKTIHPPNLFPSLHPTFSLRADSISQPLSTNLIIASWLRLLPDLPLHSGKTLTTIQKWLKKYFEIDVAWVDLTKITKVAKMENISPLQTVVFRCMVATARKDVAGILMNPLLSTGPERGRREPLRALSDHVEAALRKGSGGGDTAVRGASESPTIGRYFAGRIVFGI